MCKSATQRLTCRPESVTAGRHFIERKLDEWGVDDRDPAGQVLPETLLVVTELLANAVAASTDGVEVTMEAHRNHILFSVTDDSPVPATPGQLRRDGVGGRGLAIVAALSDRWGQSPFVDTHKTVWADVSIGKGSILAEGCIEDTSNALGHAQTMGAG